MGTRKFSELREAMLAKMTAEQREQFEAESSRRLEEYSQQQAGRVRPSQGSESHPGEAG